MPRPLNGLKIPTFNQLSPRERLLATGSALVVVIVLLDRLVLGPWWGHIHQIQRETARLEEAIRHDSRLIQRKPQILAQVEVYRDYMRTDESAKRDLATVLREIETLGTQSGVSLGEIKPLAQGSSETTAQGYALDLQYRGSLQQAVHFLYLLETSKSLFQIDRATIELKERGRDLLDGSLRVTSKAIPMRLQ